MSMNETKLYRALKKEAHARIHHPIELHRIESSFESGFPDVIWHTPHRMGGLELKVYSGSLGKRLTLLDLGLIPLQIENLKKSLSFSVAVLFDVKEKPLMLFDWDSSVDYLQGAYSYHCLRSLNVVRQHTYQTLIDELSNERIFLFK